VRSTAASNGRDERGRFVGGNSCGKGNPHAKRVARLRASLLEAVTPADVRAVVRTLVAQAKSGDVMAAKVLLERVFGPACALDYEARLVELEKFLGAEHDDT